MTVVLPLSSTTKSVSDVQGDDDRARVVCIFAISACTLALLLGRALLVSHTSRILRHQVRRQVDVRHLARRVEVTARTQATTQTCEKHRCSPQHKLTESATTESDRII